MASRKRLQLDACGTQACLQSSEWPYHLRFMCSLKLIHLQQRESVGMGRLKAL